MNNTLALIPPDWGMQVWVADVEWWKQQLQLHPWVLPELSSGRVTVHHLEGDWSQAKDNNKYSDLLVQPDFWRSVRGEWVLVFQSDSVLCSTSPHRGKLPGVWADYAFCGAPWIPKHWNTMLYHKVGNGGLSLRRRQAMIDLTSAFRYDGPAEDIFFARALEGGIMLRPTLKVDPSDRLKWRVCPAQLAAEFSWEEQTTHWNHADSEVPFGLHKLYAYLPEDRFRDVIRRCPEAERLLEVKKGL